MMTSSSEFGHRGGLGCGNYGKQIEALMRTGSGEFRPQVEVFDWGNLSSAWLPLARPHYFSQAARPHTPHSRSPSKSTN